MGRAARPSTLARGRSPATTQHHATAGKQPSTAGPSDRGSVPGRLHFWTLKWNGRSFSEVTSVCLLSIFFCQPVKNVETILSSQAIQKVGVIGWVGYGQTLFSYFIPFYFHQSSNCFLFFSCYFLSASPTRMASP